MAHASRRHILLVLHYRGGEMTAGDIAGRFACSWPTTSRHLKVLVEAGLVAARREGRERVYLLQTDRITAVAQNWIRLFDRGS
ncbi:MAG: metalloregulator ArsR/SmtB family transcription factor [Nannocystaceae bacterium]|nr:metalloregulator ArsR/SmtB family transcription factor [Nannocystaceae bacterium]